MQSRRTIVLRAPFFTDCLGTSPLPQEKCRRYSGEIKWHNGTATLRWDWGAWAQPINKGTLPGTQIPFFSFPFTIIFFCTSIFASRPVVSRFWSFLSDCWATNSQEKDHSLPTSTRHQRHPLCKEAKLCVQGERWCLLVHMSLSSLQCIVLHESAPWLVQQFCVGGPMPQFSQPLEAFQWGYQGYYEGAHSPHGVGPEVWCRGALNSGTQIWTDWFLRSYEKKDSSCQSKKKKGIFSSKCRELSFCSLAVVEFHTLSLWNGPRISSLNFSCLKIQVDLLK